MKITIKEALELNESLLNLDGYQQAVQVNGQTAVIRVPHKTSLATRIKVSNNLRALKSISETSERAKREIVQAYKQRVPEKERTPNGDAQIQEDWNAFEEGMKAEVEVILEGFKQTELEGNPIIQGAVDCLLQHKLLS